MKKDIFKNISRKTVICILSSLVVIAAAVVCIAMINKNSNSVSNIVVNKMASAQGADSQNGKSASEEGSGEGEGSEGSEDTKGADSGTKKSTQKSTKQTANSSGAGSSAGNSGSSSVTADTPAGRTLKQKNQDLINQIYSTYGYRVSYNTGEQFYYGGQNSAQLTDEQKANDVLNDIIKISGKFPSGFFSTFQGNNGYRIILYSYINGAAGVASYEFGDDNVIALDATQTFPERVFFHETWHIMENYIRTYRNSGAFSGWESLNPAGFSYGDTSNRTYTTLNVNYSDGTYYDSNSEVAFISQYAKYNAREDRAELFADLMFRPYQKDYMRSGFGVNEKAKYMAGVLRSYFNGSGAYWERFISW